MTIPVPSGMTRNAEQDITIEVDETLSGVDSGLLELTINGVVFDETEFNWSPDGLGGGIIVFRPEENGMTFVAGDTVDVHIEVFDSPDWCAPNFAQFDWIFYMEPEVTCMVLPNPFTPDGNDINDIAMFTYPNMMSETATIIVFDMDNVEVWRSDAPVQLRFDEAVGRLWNGADTNGQPVEPGLYLYLIIVQDEIICNGTMVLLR